jgi:TRAP-type C4-dicarboxylate transport system substrate-binding protein
MLRKIAALIIAAAIFSAAAADEKTMRVGSWLAPTHPMNAVVLPTWGKWIADATDGRVALKIEYHQGHPKAVFDEVQDGVYEAGWSFHGYVPGRFQLTKIAELPLLGAGPEAASAAHWRVHQKYLAAANEHEGLVLAGLFTHGPGQIMLREPIATLADMRGKKIRVGGGIQGAIAEKMGVVAVPAPGSKVYEILSQGVADGVFMPVGEQKTLRLADVAKFIFLQPEGMYLGSFSIFISPDFWNSLSAADRAAIMEVSGEKLSAYAGKVWGENDDNGLAAARAAGNTIVTAPPAEREAFRKLAAGMDDAWFAEVAGRNIDAKRALAEFRDIARNY